MKWLILLSLIACGKHEEPRKLDYGDSDGDQILNYEESELSKYVADLEPLGKVKGVLKVNINGNIQEIPFSNELDLQKNALSLLATSERRYIQEDYFLEWSKLRTQKNIPTPELKLLQYQLHVSFENGSDVADELLLLNDKGQLPLGGWSSQMKVNISAENLQALLSGKAFLALRKSFRKSSLFDISKEETIRNKTYRVHVFDGKKSRILYVSNELNFSDLKFLLGVNASEQVSQDKIFFDSEAPDEDKWYSRELPGGDKVIAYTNLNVLREKMLKDYHYQKKTLQRVNGVPGSPVKFNNPEGAQVYLKISNLSYTSRTFVEARKERTYTMIGGGGLDGDGYSSYNCTHFMRSIKDERIIPTDLLLLFENIQQRETIPSAEILEELYGEQVIWKLKLNQLPAMYEWQLINRPSSTYTITGEYKNSCRNLANRSRGAAHKTNDEGKFSVVVESYVEKIN